METLELETKSSLPPILNHSTSSEASSIMVKGNIGTRSSLLQNLSLENETILSECTNGSIGNVREQLNMLRFGKKALIADDGNSIISNSTGLSFTNNDNFELSSELEGMISFENFEPNVQSFINPDEILIDTKSNLTSSLQEKKKNSNNFITAKCNVIVKIDNGHSKRTSISSRQNSKCDLKTQVYNTFTESTLDAINGQNESQENSIISSSSFENEESPQRCINKKNTLSVTKSNCNIQLSDKQNHSHTDLEYRRENIFKNKLKHYEIKLFDYLVEQETYDGRHIEKNELIGKVFNTVVRNSTQEKEYDPDLFSEEKRLTADNGNINNSENEESYFRSNLMKTNQNRYVIENEPFLLTQPYKNNENIEEFISYFRKRNSLSYQLNKSNFYQLPADGAVHECSKVIQDSKNETYQLVNEKKKNENTFHLKNSLNTSNIEKTKTILASNEELTKKNYENNKKNHNIYSKFGKCKKLNFDVESIIGKISKTNTISGNDNIKDIISFTTLYESKDSLNSENNTNDVTDRVSSRLRKMYKSKPKYLERKSIPKQITVEDIKKVVRDITSSSMSSNLYINNIDIKYRLRKFPQNMKYKNHTKTNVKIAEMRKFLRIKLPCSSKTYTLLDCEDIIEKVNIAIRNAQPKKSNINTTITALKKLLYEKSICKNFIEFYTFITNFTPFSFQKKVLPLNGAFGCNGPKVTNKISDPLG